MNVNNDLCVYDPRSDMYEDMYEKGMPPARAVNCTCDRCFYGRDPLAMEILRLRDSMLEAMAFLDQPEPLPCSAFSALWMALELDLRSAQAALRIKG